MGQTDESVATQLDPEATGSVQGQIAGGLQTAAGMAREVTSGIDAAARTITNPLTTGTSQSGEVTLLTEKVRERYFRTEVPFGAIIYSAARANQISPELLASVVKAESRFDPTARSHRGAQGLMQLVPKTGKWMGATNLMNPTDNVQAGARYLKYLSNRFDGDQQKMVAAYNAGEGTVRKFDGVPPFRETQSYVDQVLSNRRDIEAEVTGRVAELTALNARGQSAQSEPLNAGPLL